MAITVNVYYSGKDGNALKFANEMTSSGLVKAIREEEGNLRYDYFLPIDGGETVLLIDSWKNQDALDLHHSLPLMGRIAALREKYDLHMRVERYVLDDGEPEKDRKFIRE